MKMKKILSIGALALTITTCTSISVFAAGEEKQPTAKQAAFQSVVKGGLDGKKVINKINIGADTPIKNYLTQNFIDEANEVLKDYDVKIYSDDRYYDVQKKIALKIKSLTPEKKNEALGKIKDFLSKKLGDFKVDNNEELKEKIKYYFNTDQYGTLTVGKNSNNKKTVTLEDSNGNVLVQVNSSQVNKLAAKLDSVKSYEELKEIILSYYPDAEKEYNAIIQ